MSETKSIKDMYSNDKAGQILTLALEIEGLALLIQRRGDLVNPEVNCILHDKASALLELTKVIAGSHESVEAVAAADSAPVVSCVESVGSKEQYRESDPMEKKDVETAVESEPLAGNIGRETCMRPDLFRPMTWRWLIRRSPRKWPTAATPWSKIGKQTVMWQSLTLSQ